MDRTPQRSDTRGSYSRRFARGVASAYGITLAGGGVLLRCRPRRHGGRGGRGSRRRCGRRPGSPRPKRRAQLVERVVARLFEARIPLNRAEILHRIWGPVLPAKVFVGEPREVLRVHPPLVVHEAPLPVVRLEVEDVHTAVDLVELPRDVQLLPHVPGDGVATLQFPLDLFALRVRVDRGVVGDDDRPLSRAALGEERGREQEEESELLHTTSGVCACDAESLYPRRGSPLPDGTEHPRVDPEPCRPLASWRRARGSFLMTRGPEGVKLALVRCRQPRRRDRLHERNRPSQAILYSASSESPSGGSDGSGALPVLHARQGCGPRNGGRRSRSRQFLLRLF